MAIGLRLSVTQAHRINRITSGPSRWDAWDTLFCEAFLRSPGVAARHEWAPAYSRNAVSVRP